MGDYYARVESPAPEDPKFDELGTILKINPMWAFGMSVALWCLCWKHRWVDGRLKGLKAAALARRLAWTEDPEKLIKAMTEARVLDQDPDGTYVAHNFEERQKGGIGIFMRNKNRPRKGAAAPEPVAQPDEVVRQVLQQMRLSKTPGSPQQKREHVEAWKARGINGGDILAIVTNNPGKGVFELEKLLVKSGPAAAAAASGETSTMRELKKWAREGDARDAAAAAAKGSVKK